MPSAALAVLASILPVDGTQKRALLSAMSVWFLPIHPSVQSLVLSLFGPLSLRLSVCVSVISRLLSLVHLSAPGVVACSLERVKSMAATKVGRP